MNVLNSLGLTIIIACLSLSFYLRHEKNKNQYIIDQYNFDQLEHASDFKKHRLKGAREFFGESHITYQKLDALFDLLLNSELNPFDQRMRRNIITLAKEHNTQIEFFETNLKAYYRILNKYYRCKTKTLNKSNIIIEDYAILHQDSIMLDISIFGQLNLRSNGIIEYFTLDNDVELSQEEMQNFSGPLSNLCANITNPISKKSEIIYGK